MKEIWKDIPNYEGIYQVSNLGRIRSLDRYYKIRNSSGTIHYNFCKGKILKISKDINGYLHITLYKDANRPSSDCNKCLMIFIYICNDLMSLLLFCLYDIIEVEI